LLQIVFLAYSVEMNNASYTTTDWVFCD
jgi:hypothetical protein